MKRIRLTHVYLSLSVLAASVALACQADATPTSQPTKTTAQSTQKTGPTYAYKTLYNFSNAKERGRWQIVNDGVMGGISRSQLTLQSKRTARFSGVVSLENYGGFASVRSTSKQHNLSGFQGIALRVKGDGKYYKMQLYKHNAFDGISHRVRFKTKKGVWQTFRFPFREYKPTWRGRNLWWRAKIKAPEVQRVGFMISDKQAGSFGLEIAWIKAYQAAQISAKTIPQNTK